MKAVIFLGLLIGVTALCGQTVRPNASFENWTNYSTYSAPPGWDTSNSELMSIPVFGITVVSKSIDHPGYKFFS